jgi:hypothetical protein
MYSKWVKKLYFWCTMKIEKKIWPEYFEKIQYGEKTFELRLAD